MIIPILMIIGVAIFFTLDLMSSPSSKPSRPSGDRSSRLTDDEREIVNQYRAMKRRR